jgi:hypothetical protein
MTAQSFRRRSFRLLLATAAVSLLGYAAGTSAGSAAATPSAVAARLAGAIDRAHSPSQRTKAMLAVAETLGWPVVTARGKVVSAGARNMPRGFLLYDFELGWVATGLTRRTTFSLGDLAALLTRAGLRPNGKALDANALGRGLLKTVAAAARKPAAPSSLVALLLRDLGLGHKAGRYDLASPSTKASMIRFDSAQLAILVADLTIGAVQLRSGRVLSAEGTSGAAKDQPCKGLDGLKDALSSGKLGIGILGGVLSNGVRAVTVSIELLHGTLFAQLIEAKATTSQKQSTHYGPAGHEPNAGKTLKLSVRVFNYGTPNEAAVSCGPLLGVKFPPYGPMKGVSVSWAGISDIGLDTSLNLEKYGTVSYEPADQQTGPDGIATLVFTPKNELIPGFGTVRTGRDTSAWANVHYMSALGNILGIISNYYVPLRVDFGVTVTAHVPRGFKFGPADLHFVQKPPSPPSADIDLAVQGHLCGDNPWTEAFQIDEGITVTAPGIPTVANGANYQVSIPQSGSSSTGKDFVHKWSLPAPAGPYPDSPFRLNLTVTPTQSDFNGSVTPSSSTVNPDVTEDKTCPLDQNWRLP